MSDDTVDLAAVRGIACLAVLCMALAGCATPPRPGLAGVTPDVAARGMPQSAILYRDTVTVQFSDASLCVALRPGSAQRWSGTLAGCPHLLPYSVVLPDGTGSARRVLVRTDAGGTAVLTLRDAAFGLPGGV